MFERLLMNKRSYHHGSLKKAIISEASSMLNKFDSDKISLRSIANRIGVAPSAPYNHFPDKESLFDAITSEGFKRLANQMRDSIDPALPASINLATMGKKYIFFAINEPILFNTMFKKDNLKSNKDSEMIEKIFFKAVSACFDFKINRLVSKRNASISAWSMVHGLSILLISGVLNSDSSESIDKLADELFSGISIIWSRGVAN